MGTLIMGRRNDTNKAGQGQCDGLTKPLLWFQGQSNEEPERERESVQRDGKSLDPPVLFAYNEVAKSSVLIKYRASLEFKTLLLKY